MDRKRNTKLGRRFVGVATVATLFLAAGPALVAQAGNQAPEIDAPGVYRTFPGFSIAYPVPATDPDGDDLSFSSNDLPEGSQLGEFTGLFEWTPTTEHYGGFSVPMTVTDDGVPPLMSHENFPFKVSPLDACTVPSCDPATGCDTTLLPIDQACCTEEPSIRVAEPDASCPEGRVMFVGRNNVGFGRLQNCDLLQILPFGQGGVNIRLNFEARCLDTPPPINAALGFLSARLEIDGHVFFDATDTAEVFSGRADGYAQTLSRQFPLNTAGISLTQLEGAEALLTVSLTDQQENLYEEQLRLTLTLLELENLPEAPDPDIPSDEPGCMGCHRPLVDGGGREGIEQAHPDPGTPGFPLLCVDCHGGNDSASTRTAAHVSPGASPDYIKNMASDELDAVDPDYVRFINPGDFRVAGETCGQSGCHEEIVANAPISVMATYSGHYALPRYLAGVQGRTPEYGAIDAHDPDYDPKTAPEGAIESLEALREPDPLVYADRSEMGSVLDTYLPKACPTCHMSSFGRNAAAGAYRSSGCTSCHMVYADDGLSTTDDPTITHDFPPHPVKHQLTSAIPVEQCAHCHFQGGRIGLSFRGIREGGFAPEQTPEHAVPLGRSVYGHGPDFYFTDEDSTNEVDETPPDLHYAAGMACVDCHVGADVHGDGNLYINERSQVGIRCEDCHGTVRETIEEDPGDGYFKNSKGAPMKRLRRTMFGAIALQLANEDRELMVPQIKMLLDSGSNPRMVQAMGVNKSGYSHTDSLECYSCHNAWRLTCIGCHVDVDDRLSALNLTTGETTQGGFTAQRDFYSIDFYSLGQNQRGKLSPLCSSMSMFFGYTDDLGSRHYQDKIRISGDGKKGFGWNPFHHHTVSRQPQDCNTCHPVVPGSAPDNSQTLSATYGFGTGEFMIEDGDGAVHDAIQFLDSEGNLIADFPHENTGPVPTDVRERALAIQVVPLYVPEPGLALQGLLAATALALLCRRRRQR